MYSECKPLNVKNMFTVPCGGSNSVTTFNTLVNNKGASLKDWHVNNQKIIMFFEDFYSDSYRSTEKNYTLVTDPFLIKLAIALLGDTTNMSGYALSVASSLLQSCTPYPVLVKYGSEIRKAMNHENCNKKEYIELLILTNTDKTEADSLLKNKGLPLHYKARLGDKLAEDSLIKVFRNETVFEKRIDEIQQLIFVGSINCQKALISVFNAPVYGYCYKSKVINTTKAPILDGFYRLYPEVAFISNGFSKFIRFERSFSDTSASREYIDVFLKWAFDTFKVKPEHQFDTYSMNGNCPMGVRPSRVP
jgi:hypothetical protein